jgi:hypothetical protein
MSGFDFLRESMEDTLVTVQAEIHADKETRADLDEIMDDAAYLVGDKFFSIPHANEIWKG